MGLKNAILLLTALCIVSVIFIILVEFYQSQSLYSRWKFETTKYAYYGMPENGISLLGKNIGNPGSSRIKNSKIDYDFNDQNGGNNGVRKVKGSSTKINPNTTSSTQTENKKVRARRRRRFMRMKKDAGDLSEEEKLKMSPYIYNEEEENRRLSIPVVEKEVKYISYFLPWELNRMKKTAFSGCRYKKCAFVLDMSKAHLVAFAANHLKAHGIPTYIRPPGQRWLMYTIDPSIRDFRLDRNNLKSLFNDTHTYNLDSDIPFIFGRLQKIVISPAKDYDRLYENKSRMIAWFVSHCKTASKREKYVKRMQSILDVDIFGECGNMTCGGKSQGQNSRSLDSTICLPMLTNTYKFYLAFENAYCLDYVTEKFFKLFQDIQVIPVVRGGFQYKKYLPSGIFVDADDFQSPEGLAKHLLELGNDRQRYMEMLRRKDEWRVVKPPARECALCEYIHSNPPKKFYPNLQEKFGPDLCYYPKILKRPVSINPITPNVL